jgi:FkbM family methyltransferase
MQMLDSARLIARSAAIEVPRLYSERLWKRGLVKQLQSRGVDVVLDVGANSGQYATGLRKAAYKSRIVSFEPLSKPFAALERKASADSLWDCERYALGDADGTISVNVAGNAAQSSSVLPMLEAHQNALPSANYIGAEDVPVHRLDSVAPKILQPADRIFLKVDVQGFEKQVLAGSRCTIDGCCVGMQLELSVLPLYEGGMLIREALELVYSLGFTLTGLFPSFTDQHDGRMLQVDGIFFREHN